MFLFPLTLLCSMYTLLYIGNDNDTVYADGSVVKVPERIRTGRKTEVDDEVK